MPDETPGTVPPPTPAGIYRVLAWVGVVAGIVFIAGAVFAGGYAFGGGYPGWHRTHPGGAMGAAAPGMCPMMQPGGMMGGMMGGMDQDDREPPPPSAGPGTAGSSSPGAR